MSRSTDAVGAYGERVAARTLTDAGMSMIERNWRCATGEIDIVALDGATLVFCEVKTRRGERVRHAGRGGRRSKVRRLRALAATGWPPTRGCAAPVRFDVISVWPRPAGPAAVEHLRGAF